MKIEKLDLDLFEDAQEDDYTKARAKFIAEYEKYVPSTREYHPGGFFSSGYWTGKERHKEKDPILGEAEWNQRCPSGYKDWAGGKRSLNAYGEQMLIDKMNEIIEFLNTTK